jgi:hypothetical protein
MANKKFPPPFLCISATFNHYLPSSNFRDIMLLEPLEEELKTYWHCVLQRYEADKFQLQKEISQHRCLTFAQFAQNHISLARVTI